MRFVPGIDYGIRKGTLGFAVHMAEGGDGTLRYLARRTGESDADWRTRVRGVSANFVILSTGEIVQMVPWGRASGSMNPRDRGKTSGFYRTQIIQDVLGSFYTDPNAWSISVEVTGFRAQGPNDKQVAALIALVADARNRYPTLRGAYGHADQTDTKGCPGLAAGMLSFWNEVGHGLFRTDTTAEPEEPVGPRVIAGAPFVGVATVVKDDANIIASHDGEFHPIARGRTRNVTGIFTMADGKYAGQQAYAVAIPTAEDQSGYLLADLCTYKPASALALNETAIRRDEYDRIAEAATVTLPPRP